MSKKEKVIFLQDSKWGKKYEIKELPWGFVKNYLLSHKKVFFYNEKNSQQVEHWRKKQEQENILIEENARKLYEKIHNFALSFTLKKDEKNIPFGSVGFKEILTELEKNNFQLEKKQLLNFHPLNKLGENIIKIKLSNNLTADLKVTIS